MALIQQTLSNFDQNEFAWKEQLLIDKTKDAGKRYACNAIVNTLLQGEYESNTIIFIIPDTLIESENCRSESGYVGEKFAIYKYINFNFDSNNTILSVWHDDKILMEGRTIPGNDQSIIINENQEICFQEKGDYNIQIKENGILRTKICFHIEAKPCPYKEVIIIVIAFAIVFVLVFGIVKRAKHR